LIGILPRFVGRALRHPWLRELPPLNARSPLGRSGAVSAPRSSSLRLPDARSLRPGYTRRRYFFRLASVIGDSSSFDSSTLDRVSPLRVALRRAASCHRAGSLAGHPGPPAFGECALIRAWRASCPKIATTSCRHCRYRSGALASCAVDARGRHRAENTGGHPARQQKRPPCGGLVKRRFTPVHRLDHSSKRPDPILFSKPHPTGEEHRASGKEDAIRIRPQRRKRSPVFATIRSRTPQENQKNSTVSVRSNVRHQKGR